VKHVVLLIAAAALFVPKAFAADEPAKGAGKEADKASAEVLEKRLQDARHRLDEAAHEVAELSMSLADDHGGPVSIRMHGRSRSNLGIVIGVRGEDDQADGVKILSVTPGGAAEGAGLRAGDVLTDINGKSLKREGDTSGREKLLATMREVKPGEKVNLSYRRDGKVAKADVVAKAPAFDEGMPFNVAVGPGIKGMIGPRKGFWQAEGAFGSTELVTLTPKLGQYFGTDKGVLVVRAPQDSRLKLEDGDVLVDIDGRVPTSPAHAFKILGSYQPGEKVKLTVLRMKKRMTIEVAVPEQREHDTFFFRQSFAPGMPAPPMPALPDEPISLPPPPPETT
jgi:S1-C subfamily serine protease